MLDAFPVMLMKSALNDGNILYVNRYVDECIGRTVDSDEAVANLSSLFSKASLIFYESHIKPSLIEYGKLNEVQITVLADGNERLPVITNLVLKDQIVYWSMYTCVARDKLYQELITARETLEKKSEKLAASARIDHLTGIDNRRAALNDFDKLHHQIRRLYTPLVVLLIDIDWFKKINDQFGHDFGDDVLCALSNHMKKHVREVDILARWGGEEFLMILYDTDISGASKFAQRLIDDVRQIIVNDTQSLTVSIGMAEVTAELANQLNCLDIAIKYADMALYDAKRQGRDRVVCWEATSVQPDKTEVSEQTANKHDKKCRQNSRS